MIESEGRRIELAASAHEEELMLLVHDPSPKVILGMFDNRNLTEEHILIIANRKEVFGQAFHDSQDHGLPNTHGLRRGTGLGLRGSGGTDAS